VFRLPFSVTSSAFVSDDEFVTCHRPSTTTKSGDVSPPGKSTLRSSPESILPLPLTSR
jgi:hypothetical protein